QRHARERRACQRQDFQRRWHSVLLVPRGAEQFHASQCGVSSRGVYVDQRGTGYSLEDGKDQLAFGRGNQHVQVSQRAGAPRRQVLCESRSRRRKKSRESKPRSAKIPRHFGRQIIVKGRWVVVGISAAALVPVLALLLLVLWMGFWQNGPGEPIVYTLNHYRKIFTDPFTYKTFLNTVGFAGTAMLVSLFFAVPTAWLVERTDLPGKNFILMLVTLGALLPTFFTAMGWVFLLHPRIGIVNRFFVDLFGLQQAPFNIASIIGMGWVEGLGLSSSAFIMVVATYRT